MGCRKNRYNLVCGSHIKKILFAWFVSVLWLSILTPMVVADTTSIKVTFNPEGGIDIDVSPKTYNFTTVQAGSYKTSTGSHFTLYNNGTVPMDTQIFSNATTDSDQLTLDANGGPVGDTYSFITVGLSNDAYIPAAAAAEQSQNLAGSTTDTFDINLTMGTPLTSNFTWQRTTINLTGSIS